MTNVSCLRATALQRSVYASVRKGYNYKGNQAPAISFQSITTEMQVEIAFMLRKCVINTISVMIHSAVHVTLESAIHTAAIEIQN